MSQIPTLVELNDGTIKTMLARHCVDVIKPPPPHDLAFTSLTDNGTFWIIARFFDVNDPGYAAYGIPENLPEEERKWFISTVLETFQEGSKYPQVPMQWLELNPVESN